MKIRLRSHRARENFVRFIGRRPRAFFSFDDRHHYYEVTDAEWARFLRAKRERRTYWHGSVCGARLKRGAHYMPCLKFERAHNA